MQENNKQTTSEDQRECSTSSVSSFSNSSTPEDLASWTSAMASAQASRHRLGTPEGDLDDKRISSATVFESMGEGLAEIARKPAVPLRPSKLPAPPPDMEDIE